jgi:hypothetical protein
MDGQLSPDQEEWVESAVASDPQLAEKLRRLTSVRDLLAGLSRDASVEVTPQVMDRIRRRIRLRAFLVHPFAGSAPARGWFAAHDLLGIAAVLLIVLGISFVHRLLPASDGQGVNSRSNIASHPEPETITIVIAGATPTEVLLPSFPPQVFAEGVSSELESGARRAADLLQTGDGSRAAGEVEQVRQYLDNPNLRRIFLVADLDGTAQKQVASVVERTTRFHFYKITISQGIVIDPRHPDQATVFALVVNPNELDTLRRRLRTALMDRVEEPVVDPSIVTQLADIGPVQELTPAPLGEIMTPPNGELAIRQDVGPLENQDRGFRDRPTPEQERSEPVADLIRPNPETGPYSHPARIAAAGPLAPANPAADGQGHSATLVSGEHPGRGPRRLPAPAGPPDSVVVLVWVSRVRAG